MRVTILGSGTSHGVPMIGCVCPVCLSTDPRDKRFRPSICVEHHGKVALVDTTPELRLQSLRFGLSRVDAVFITHTHADHIFGFDEIRRFNDLTGAVIPVYGDAGVHDDIRRIFQYVFTETQPGGGKPKVELRLAEPRMKALGMDVRSIPVMHGRLPILAYRFDDVAYVTDVNHIPPESMAELQSLDLLILDTVRPKPHGTHFGLDQALDVIGSLRPRRALLTHLSHHYAHEATNARLPNGVRLAYDGQTIDL